MAGPLEQEGTEIASVTEGTSNCDHFQAPPWKFGSEAGKVGCSEASRCLGKAPEPGRGLSGLTFHWLVCLFVFVCPETGMLIA